MSQSEQKVVQYLGEAHASEIGLVSVLRSQIAITPRGSYRDGLEKHLAETRKHAGRIQQRLGELRGSSQPAAGVCRLHRDAGQPDACFEQDAV